MAWLLVPLAYLLGSVSCAYWAGRLKGIDLRQHGSGNLGATNAGRVLGGRWFAVVFVADLLKGLGPVLLARAAGGDWLPLAVGGAAVAGHVLTCFHGFKGGKAVATSLGVVLGLAPVAAGAAFALWLLVWLLGWAVFGQRRSDAVAPASMLAALAVVPAYLLSGASAPPTLGFLAVLAAVVLVRHRANLARIVARIRGGGAAEGAS